MSVKRRVITALIGLLVLAGCAWYFSDAMGYELARIESAWTIILIAIGFVNLFSGNGILGSLGLMIVGGGILVRDNGWLGGVLEPVSVWQMIAAVVMLIIGLSILGSALGIRKKHRHIHSGAHVHNHGKTRTADGGEANVIFGEQCYRYDGMVFSGVDVSGIFGSAVLDLRGAVIDSDCTIEANGVFGAVEIITDSHFNCKVEGTGVFGSVNDHTNHQYIEGLPTVTVTANAVFGSVEVR